jgi:hypothetical protein
MAANTDARRRPSTDLTALHSVVHELIGKKCWKVAFTYAGNLSLHFGKRRPYEHPRMRGKKKGEWILGTVGTHWRLITPNEWIMSRRGREKYLVAKAKALEGQKVTRINVSVPDYFLTIAFGQQYLFQITPTDNDARWSLPYWELLGPDHRLITFGPGNTWSYGRSDVPLAEEEDRRPKAVTRT